MSKINPELAELLQIAEDRILKQAEAEKSGFVDPSMASGAAGGMAGGMPGGAEGMPPAGGDAAMAGPMPPMPGMGIGGDPASGLSEERVIQLIQQHGMGAGAGAGTGADGMKKKVDVNTEIYHIKKLLVHMAEQLGMSVPATMLLGDPADDPQATPEEMANDPASAGASPESAIAPIQALQAASPALAAAGGGGGGEQAPKTAEDSRIRALASTAAAHLRLLKASNKNEQADSQSAG